MAAMLPKPDYEPTLWSGCYDDNWNGYIVPEAFSHPAKYARGLIQRIIETGLARGYWKADDLIGDPFGGIASGGIIAGYHGLNWLGVELEPRFVELGNRNLAMHGPQFMVCGATSVRLVQGDSRQFASIVGQACGMVTSPPYAESIQGAGEDVETTRARMAARGDDPKSIAKVSRFGNDACSDYGQTTGNIGNLKSGELTGIVTSPPYESSLQSTENVLENMQRRLAAKGETRQTSAVMRSVHGIGDFAGYQGADGSICAESGETYWQAMRQVYGRCQLALKPGGIMAVVVKDYVKGGKRVPLCDQTATLLTSLGFEVFERCHAMLVKEDRHPSLFGGDEVKKTERKSFFRRLAEKKGSPPIDYEVVLWVRSQRDLFTA